MFNTNEQFEQTNRITETNSNYATIAENAWRPGTQITRTDSSFTNVNLPNVQFTDSGYGSPQLANEVAQGVPQNFANELSAAGGDRSQMINALGDLARNTSAEDAPIVARMANQAIKEHPELAGLNVSGSSDGQLNLRANGENLGSYFTPDSRVDGAQAVNKVEDLANRFDSGTLDRQAIQSVAPGMNGHEADAIARLGNEISRHSHGHGHGHGGHMHRSASAEYPQTNAEPSYDDSGRTTDENVRDAAKIQRLDPSYQQNSGYDQPGDAQQSGQQQGGNRLESAVKNVLGIIKSIQKDWNADALTNAESNAAGQSGGDSGQQQQGDTNQQQGDANQQQPAAGGDAQAPAVASKDTATATSGGDTPAPATGSAPDAAPDAAPDTTPPTTTDATPAASSSGSDDWN